jgi:dihydrolipoamide dehydrogenase
MPQTYDVLIIGGGPGGYNAAVRAGQLGLKTALVEKRESKTLGGTCLNVGCIPSKALLNASEFFEAARTHLPRLGVKTSVELDLPQMMKQKDEAVDGLTKGVAFLMKKHKVDVFFGAGEILGPGRARMTSDGGESQDLDARHIVIATGSDVTPLPSVAIDEERVVSSTGALFLEKVPRRLLVVGAGVIGLELGSVWRRLGAEVTVVEFLDRVLPGMDGEVSKAAQRIFAKQGIKFRLSSKVAGVEKSKTGLKVAVENSLPAHSRASENPDLDPRLRGDERVASAAAVLEADVVLVAIGRRPYTDGLGLERAGVKTDERGFVVTNGFRTSVEGVWAIGDVIRGPMLAHRAEDDAVACIETIAGRRGHVNYDAVPNVVYTAPEIAAVGKTEEELKAGGVAYKAGRFPFTANSRARTYHDTEGFVKLIADANTDRLLGAHIVGTGAGELIAECVSVLEFGGASEDIARTSHAHPTRSEAVRQAAMAVEGWTMQM